MAEYWRRITSSVTATGLVNCQLLPVLSCCCCGSIIWRVAASGPASRHWAFSLGRLHGAFLSSMTCNMVTSRLAAYAWSCGAWTALQCLQNEECESHQVTLFLKRIDQTDVWQQGPAAGLAAAYDLILTCYDIKLERIRKIVLGIIRPGRSRTANE